MAANIKIIGQDGTETNASRKDIFALPPFNVLRTDSKNRRRKMIAETAIIALAENMMEVGNQEPIKVRKLPEPVKGPNGICTVEVVFGYSRHRAAEWIALNHPDKMVQLKCMLFDGNEEQAVLEGISENRFRHNTTPLDDAFNQQWLRDNKLWPDAEIARFYKMNPSQVSKLKLLLKLNAKVQDAISDKEIEADGCYEMADLPEDQQLEILNTLRAEGRASAHYDVDQLGKSSHIDTSYAARTSNPNPNRTGQKEKEADTEAEAAPTVTKKIATSKVKKAVRAAKHAMGKKGPALSLKDVKEFFGTINAPNEDEAVREFCRKFEEFCAGDISEVQMENALYKLRDVKEDRMDRLPDTDEKKKAAPKKK